MRKIWRRRFRVRSQNRGVCTARKVRPRAAPAGDIRNVAESIDLTLPDFANVPGFKPVIGRIQHLTALMSPPPDGVCDTLCGATVRVTDMDGTTVPVGFGCFTCALEFVEEYR
ncbi:hypothetical protein FHU38_000103 [Saccharomonospora amisosensis]|uniref:Uncharacterized protein n=1 Tax=Saccharomonospora amisosensis TaxID=1128677 RepID=A0A7X5ZNL5_9PSEU|nr:hypothetical protein [Saccharomonospora amisosensis]NIJ09759.1 hypothetical protein [Saccharomonospora amisosensis]